MRFPASSVRALATGTLLLACWSAPALAQSAPICNAGPHQTVPCQGASTVVQLDGSASFDPDGGSLTYSWVSCPGSTLSNPNGPVTTLTIDTSSNCTLTCGVRLVVTDIEGKMGFCRTFVNVIEAPNTAPICVANVEKDIIQCQGATTVVQLDGSASFDPNGDPLTFQWVSCPGSTLSDPNSPTPILTIDTSQTCDITCGVRLVVTDPQGKMGFCRVFVRVGPDCCEPEKPTVLSLQYVGSGSNAAAGNTQEPGKVSCTGDPMNASPVHIKATNKDGKKVFFDGIVNLGDTFDMDVANAGVEKFDSDSKVVISSLGGSVLQTIVFHTSCSQPLFAGDVFCSIRLVSCPRPPPPPPDCCDEGKPKTLSFVYSGKDCSATSHHQDPSKVTCSGDPMLASPVRIVASNKDGKKVYFDGTVDINTSFDISAANAGEKDFASDTLFKIYNTSGGLLQEIKMHTSCSQPLINGDVFGSLTLTACPPPGGGGGSNVCVDGRPQALGMIYTGDDCSASQHTQAAGKVICSGNPAFASPVHIVADDTKGGIMFDGMVNLGASFEIDATNAGLTKLSTNTHVLIHDASGNLLQDLIFHTSCSQPMNIGDQYGALKLASFTPEP